MANTSNSDNLGLFTQETTHTSNISLQSNYTTNRSHFFHGDIGSNSASNTAIDVLYMVVTPALCILGVLGNITNLVVLTKIRMRMRKAEGGKESGTQIGLLILAVSDMLFCIALFPRGVLSVTDNYALFEHKDFKLYYQAYGTGVVTTFILTSTWITVVMATLRYIGICHPLHARKFDGVHVAKVTYAAVLLICILFNLPSFWQYKIETLGADGPYLLDIGDFQIRSFRGMAFQWARAIFGIFLPAFILAFCNWSLIQALRQSYRMRKECRVQESASRNSNRITLLLVVIVMSFVLFVFPSELMDFCQDLLEGDTAKTEAFLIIRALANVLQVINFSFNFVLYCVLNIHFRKTLRELLSCRRLSWRLQKRKGHMMRLHSTSRVSRTSMTNLSTKPGFTALPVDSVMETQE